MLAMLLAAATLNPKVAIMIHGAGGGGWEWTFWAKRFEKAGYQVIAPDLIPAKGGLAKTHLSDYVAQVRNWAAGSDHPVIIGASMGGMLALKAAEGLQPSAVVLVNSVPPAGLEGKPHPAVVKWANGPLKDTQDSMPDSDQDTIQWAWKKWRDESGVVMDELSKGSPVARPNCPILVVYGANDTDVPPAKSKETAAFLRADVFGFAGMSHVGPLMGRHSDVVADRVLNWLKGRLPAR